MILSGNGTLCYDNSWNRGVIPTVLRFVIARFSIVL